MRFILLFTFLIASIIGFTQNDGVLNGIVKNEKGKFVKGAYIVVDG